jgi:phage terminase small subunit
MAQAIKDNDGEKVLGLLTEKQRLFCYEFLKDLNGSQAALRAGYNTKYPEKVANELKRNEGVQVALAFLRKGQEEKLSLDVSFVLNKIVKSMERAEKKGNETAVLRGAELLAKHLGMFVDRQEISGPNGEAIHVKEEQLRQTTEEFKSKILSLSRKSNANLKIVGDE